MEIIRSVLLLNLVVFFVQTTNAQASIRGRLLTPEEGCGLTGSMPTTRIVGGSTATPNSYPWMALLMTVDRYTNETSFDCGGSLITSRHVLTAAHCVNSDLFAVRLGEHQIGVKSGESPEDIRISHIEVHPFWDAKEVSHDLAILTLERDVTFTHRIRPICIPQGLIRNYDGMKSYVAGWGLTKEKGSKSDILKTVQVSIISNSQCEALFRKQIAVRPNQYDNRVICAGCLEGGKGCCQGDSGGPLMLPFSVNGKFPMYQVGIVSYGVGCARKDIPGVYTRVQTFISWIERTIKK